MAHRFSRRRLLRVLQHATWLAIPAGLRAGAAAANDYDAHPQRSWYRVAQRMKQLAESWGDQPYGAALVLDGRVVGEGPSRVVLRADPTAHAEREAIRDAARRLPGRSLAGSILYSTSRPCAMCEAAAAAAGIARMYYGEGLADAGRPRS